MPKGCPDWTCSECGSMDSFTTVLYDAGDSDLRCNACGSVEVEESPVTALRRAIDRRDREHTEMEQAIRKALALLTQPVQSTPTKGRTAGMLKQTVEISRGDVALAVETLRAAFPKP